MLNVATKVVRFTVQGSGLIALWFSSYLLDDIEFAPDLRTRLPGLLKEPDELWIRQGIEFAFHLSNPWPRPGLAALIIESLGAVFIRTVLKRTLHRTRAGLNPACPDTIGAGRRETRKVEPEQLLLNYVWNVLNWGQCPYYIYYRTNYDTWVGSYSWDRFLVDWVIINGHICGNTD